MEAAAPRILVVDDNAENRALAEATLTDEGFVELLVTDAGAGIAPELRASIFERFVQLDAGQSSDSRTSRGLGLAFCKLAVEAHGGTIAVESGNPGATFLVRLPQ